MVLGFRRIPSSKLRPPVTARECPQFQISYSFGFASQSSASVQECTAVSAGAGPRGPTPVESQFENKDSSRKVSNMTHLFLNAVYNQRGVLAAEPSEEGWNTHFDVVFVGLKRKTMRPPRCSRPERKLNTGRVSIC